MLFYKYHGLHKRYLLDRISVRGNHFIRKFFRVGKILSGKCQYPVVFTLDKGTGFHSNP